ncbi:hypothetical protein EAF04_005898 [Stromatinia cepivora]|nr:hypothetical protein EAF04_005898 [Stromatinia cepivora]
MKRKIHTSRWLFSGQLLPVKDKLGRNSIAYGAVYRRLRWELTENDLEARSLHSNIIHTGLALEHEYKPFYLHVEIDGKLKRVKDRIMKHMKFSSASRGNQGLGTASTLINLGSGIQYKRNLNDLAAGLPMAMEWANMSSVSLQIPEALPASFESVKKLPHNRPAGTESTLHEHHTDQKGEARKDNRISLLTTSAPSTSEFTDDSLFKILSAAPSIFSIKTEHCAAPAREAVNTLTSNLVVASAGDDETKLNSSIVPSTALSSISPDAPAVFSMSNSTLAGSKHTSTRKKIEKPRKF